MEIKLDLNSANEEFQGIALSTSEFAEKFNLDDGGMIQ